MPTDKTFKVGKDVYDIPAHEVANFLKDNPQATEVQSFVMGKDTFDIPLPEVSSFIKDVPDAKPLKKKEPTVSGGTPSVSPKISPKTPVNTPTQSDLSNERQSVRPDSYFPAPKRLTSSELGHIDKNLARTLYQHNQPNVTSTNGQTTGELNATKRRQQASLQGQIMSLQEQKKGKDFLADDFNSYNPERAKLDKEIQAKKEQLKTFQEPEDMFDRIPGSDNYAENKDVIENYLKDIEIADPEGYKVLKSKAEKGVLTEQDYFSQIVAPALNTQIEVLGQDFDILKERGLVDKAAQAYTLFKDIEELKGKLENYQGGNPTEYEALVGEIQQKDEQLKSIKGVEQVHEVMAKSEQARQAYGNAVLAIGKDLGIVTPDQTEISDEMAKGVMNTLDKNRKERAGYGQGMTKSFGQSVANVFDDIDKLGKFAAKHTGLGDILLDKGYEGRKGLFGDAAEYFRRDTDYLNDMPNTWTGTVLNTAIPMTTLIAEMAMFPEIRMARLAKATGGVVKAIPAFTTMEATLGGIREWDKLVTANPEEQSIALETLKATGEGAALGTGLHFLGAFGGETSKFVAKYVKGNFVPAATAFGVTGTAFGTLDAFEQYMTTGKIDLAQSTAVGVGASVLSAPHVMKALAGDAYKKAKQHFSTSSKEVIQKAQEMPAKPEELLTEAIEQKKQGNEKEAAILNTMANVKMVADEVVANPEKFRKEIKESDLTDKEKQFHLDKIDETVKFDKELRTSEDKTIIENQKRLGLPSEVSIPLSDATGETLAKMEAGEPVINARLKEASKDLYSRYKGLLAEKNNHNRKNTTEQIDKVIVDLEGKIEKLETRLQEQGETGEFMGIIKPESVVEKVESTIAEPAQVETNPEVTNQEVTKKVEQLLEQDNVDRVAKKINSGEKVDLSIDKMDGKGVDLNTENCDYYVMHSDGGAIGWVSIDKGTSKIQSVQIHESLQKKGYGTKLYEMVNEQLTKEGKPSLKSDEMLSEGAVGLWKSLEKSGSAKVVGNVKGKNGKLQPVYEMVAKSTPPTAKTETISEKTDNVPQAGKSVEINTSTPSGITPTEKPIITPEKVQSVSQKSDKIATETDDIRIVDGEVFTKVKNATAAKKGHAFFSNGKSRFEEGYKSIQLPERLEVVSEKVEPEIRDSQIENKPLAVNPKNKGKSQAGKAIEPNPEVKTDLETAIYEVATQIDPNSFKGIDGKPQRTKHGLLHGDNGKLLFEIAKGKTEKVYDESNLTDEQISQKISEAKSALRKTTNTRGIEFDIEQLTRLKKDRELYNRLSKMEDAGYIEEVNEVYTVTEKGQAFINAVNARIETRKGVKAGTDLFPEYSGIPEVEKKLKQIADEYPNTRPETIRTFAGKTESESKQLEPVVKALEGKAKIAGSLKKEAIERTIEEIDKVVGEVNESKVKLDELNTAIAKLKADNPNEFKKDGTLKASSKIAPALKSLSDKRAEAADKYAKEFPELSKKQKEASRKETDAINKAFEARQKDLEARTNTTKEEILEASIEDKLRFRQELSKEEIAYANENMFRPKGFDYGKDGLEPSKVVEQTKDIPQEKKDVSGETIPESADGKYQIYTVKVKNKEGGIDNYFGVPSPLNKGLKGFGDDLVNTLDQAIKTAEYNRFQEGVIAERKADRELQKQKEEVEKQAKLERNKGKTKQELMQEGLTAKVLSVKERVNGKVKTRKEHIEDAIEAGSHTEVEQVNKVKEPSRRAYNRMDNRQQAEHERRVKEGGKVAEYRLFSNENTFRTITKAEYDYAKLLEANKKSNQVDNQVSNQAKTIPDLQEALQAGKITKAEYDKQVEEIRSVQPKDAKPGESVGTYNNGQPVVLGGLDFIRPVELPEMVALAKELIGSPVVRKMSAEKNGMFRGGKGITLNRELFKQGNEKQLAATLAHEVGHLVDFLPDKTMKRGNLLGRLYTLREFMNSGISDTKPWTSGELKKLKNEARDGVLAENNITIDNWNKGKLPTAEKKRIGEEIDAEYKRLKTDNAILLNSDISKELKELSKLWRPWDETTATAKFKSYRNSSAELYADAISVLLNNPGLLETKAPKFYDKFFGKLDNKPEVRDAMFALQDLIRDPVARDEARLEAIYKGFSAAREKRKAIANEEIVENKLKGWNLFVSNFVSKIAPSLKFMPSDKRLGIELSAKQALRNQLEMLSFINNKEYLYIKENEVEVFAALDAIGVKFDDLGALGMFDRNLSDRLEKANPLGLQQEMNADLRKILLDKYSPEQADVAEQILKNFHKKFFTLVEDGYKEGLYKDDVWKEKIEPYKDTYLSYAVVDYITKNHISEGVKEMTGTLREVENPIESTMLKALSVIRATQTQRAKNLLFENLHTLDPDNISDARPIFSKPNNDRTGNFAEETGKAQIKYYKNGVWSAKNVDPWIAEVFTRTEPAHLDALTQLFHNFNAGFKPAVTKYNLGFAFAMNLERDSRRSVSNLYAILNSMSETKRPVADMLLGPASWLWHLPKSVREGYRIGKNQFSDLATEMVENAAFDFRTGVLNKYDPNANESVDIMYSKYGLGNHRLSKGEALKKRGPILKSLINFHDFYSSVTGAMELGSKVNGYKILRKRGLSAESAGFYTRNYIGTPNYKERGNRTYMSNEYLPFSNVIAQGIRADAELAFTGKTAGAYWLAQTMWTVAPAMVLGSVAAGMAGSYMKDLYSGIGSYDLLNYLCVPYGKTETGKTKYVRIAMDEFSRAIYANSFLLSKSLTEKDTPSINEFTQIAKVGSSFTPSISPLYKIASANYSYWVDQTNPYDSFYDRKIVDNTNFNAGGWNSHKQMLSWTVGASGLSFVTRLSQYDPSRNTTSEYVKKNLPIWNRIMKESDQGIYERSQDVVDENTTESAKERLVKDELIFNYAKKYYSKTRTWDSSLFDQMMKEMSKEYFGSETKGGISAEDRPAYDAMYKKFKTNVAKGIQSPITVYVTSVVNKRSNKDKAAQLALIKKEVDPMVYRELVTFLIRERMITPDVIRKANTVNNSQ